ncbi:MAG: DUF58 domain-containing protein [Janthinobacterium lividum]
MKRFVLNIAGLFVAIVAVLFGLSSLYLMAAILWLIPAVSYLMGWLMLGGLASERSLPLSATAGEAVLLTYTLANQGRLPKFYLLVRDTLPRGVHLVNGPPPLILGIWPGEERETQCLVEVRRRGVFSLGPANVFSTDPLGLQTFSQKMPTVSELVVYPAVLPLHDSWLRGAAAAGWRGSASALVRGDGDDFYGVREYGPGDELRRVHWRTTARTGKLAVAEYAQGITLDVTIALDLSMAAYKGTGTDDQSALEYAVTLTATLIGDLLRHGHTVRLLTAGNREGGSAARSAEELPRFLELLARVQSDSLQTLADVLAEDKTGSQRPATFIAITPEWPNPSLMDQLQNRDMLGGQSFIFALDAASFRTGMPGLPSSLGTPNTRLVRLGDDLATLLEREAHGWTR